MQEIWKPVKNFEELYSVSNLGNVISIGRYQYNINKKEKEYINIPKKLKFVEDRGYFKLHLSRDGKRTTKYIHQLVAEAFIPNPNNYKEVNHKDSDPSNNRVDNLEWCDRKYNIDYMVKHQQELKELNEMRLETLETIYYGIDGNYIKTLDEVKNLIEPMLKMNRVR